MFLATSNEVRLLPRICLYRRKRRMKRRDVVAVAIPLSSGSSPNNITAEKLPNSQPAQPWLNLQVIPSAAVDATTNIIGTYTGPFESLLRPNWKYLKRRVRAVIGVLPPPLMVVETRAEMVDVKEEEA
ncbi:unnamed protein product [Linum trigynum]|uniref:Uncharacterized protein n=1 Tax=Linum trigynum TaxID=586398 RepID=A0AAV2GQV4_9ROSI